MGKQDWRQLWSRENWLPAWRQLAGRRRRSQWAGRERAGPAWPKRLFGLGGWYFSAGNILHTHKACWIGQLPGRRLRLLPPAPPTQPPLPTWRAHLWGSVLGSSAAVCRCCFCGSSGSLDRGSP